MSDEKGRPRQLGRGLEALFGEDRTNIAGAEAEIAAGPAPATPDQAAEGADGSVDGAATPSMGFRLVAIGKLIPNPMQPRRHFDDAALKDLTASIREQGILQPLIVRPTRSEAGTFEIVAGERRWRAAQRAQIHEAPVIIRDFTDEEALAVALIENIQRDELSPIEEAEAYARLSHDFGKTQEQVAEVVGKSRSHIANMTRLLDLPEDVRDMLADGQLSAGHARAILRAPDPAALARQILAEGLTVRDAETLGKSARGRKGTSGGRSGGKSGGKSGSKSGSVHPKDADTLALERELGYALGLKVDIRFDGKAGRISLDYRSLEQLDDIVERLMGNGPHIAAGGIGDAIAGDSFEFGGATVHPLHTPGHTSGNAPGHSPTQTHTGPHDIDAPAPRDGSSARPGPSARPGYDDREDPPWEGARRHAPDNRQPGDDEQNPDRAQSERPDDD